MRFWLSLLLLCFVTACSTLPEPRSIEGVATPWQIQQHQQQVSELRGWKIKGKLAIITPQEKLSGRLNWVQSPESFAITLSSSLGITLLEAEQTVSHATLEVEGEIYHGTSLEQLISQLTPWQLPTTQMQQWVKGHGDIATATAATFTPQGQLASMTTYDQFGQQWQLAYSHYIQQGERPHLPSRITLIHNDIKLKLIISQWHI